VAVAGSPRPRADRGLRVEPGSIDGGIGAAHLECRLHHIDVYDGGEVFIFGTIVAADIDGSCLSGDSTERYVCLDPFFFLEEGLFAPLGDAMRVLTRAWGAERPYERRNLTVAVHVQTAMKAAVALALTVVCVACAPSPSTTTGGFEVRGYVHAGPTCPVVREPPDPNCADRPVANAEMVVMSAGGTEAARAVTDDQGRFVVVLSVGAYVLVPQRVEGLVGTAPEQTFAVPGTTELDVAYDTGIR